MFFIMQDAGIWNPGILQNAGLVLVHNPGLPVVREKLGKKFIFQGQGKVREFYKKKIFVYGKVREKSGNFAMNTHDTFFYHSRAPLCCLV